MWCRLTKGMRPNAHGPLLPSAAAAPTCTMMAIGAADPGPCNWMNLNLENLPFRRRCVYVGGSFCPLHHHPP